MGRHGRPLPRRRTKAELRRDKIAAYFALMREWFSSDLVIEIIIVGFFFALGAGAAYFGIKTGM